MKNRKLRKFIDVYIDGNYVKGYKNLRLNAIYQLIDIYNGVQFKTISSDVAEILEKCGVRIAKKGIGWAVLNN